MLENAVYQRPTFEKKAEYELSKDITKWNEEILKHFFNDVPFAPKDAGVNVVINHVDENKGYAKGSVVVFYQHKQVNYPVIVKDFKLFPFDVMFVMVDDVPVCMNSSDRNLKKALLTNEMGELRNLYEGMIGGQIKSPGNIPPKSHIPLDNAFHDLIMQDQSTYNLRKLSFWAGSAKKEDLEKFAIQLEAEPNVRNSFVETTGDLVSQVVQLAHDQEQQVPKNHADMKLDVNDVVDAKRAVVAIESEFVDMNKLIPLRAPSVCEIRTYVYPTMSDFMDAGASAIGRLQASKTGAAKAGVLLSVKDYDEDSGCEPVSYNPNDDEKKKAMRERQDQIFISSCGGCYKIKRDYDKNGICFYGSAVMDDLGLMPKLLENIQNSNINDFYRTQHEDGSDKPINQPHHTNRDIYAAVNAYGVCKSDSSSHGLLLIYGAGQLWECMKFGRVNRVWEVEGRKVYISDGEGFAIIPANVVAVQRVRAVDGLTQPMYKMILGDKIKKIFLVPENAIVLNTRFMKEIGDGDIMSPSKSIQEIYKEQAISKIAVRLGSEGISITGAAVQPFNKVAGLSDGTEMGGREAVAVLGIMGVDGARANEIIKHAMAEGSVNVYGCRSDYIKANPYDRMEKSAMYRSAMTKLAQWLRLNLVKEASVLEDPEAVDVVLSLNFINEDNLNDYVDNITAFNKAMSKLCELLIATRMGLSDVDSGAIRKAIDGLEKTVNGLEGVKLALGK